MTVGSRTAASIVCWSVKFLELCIGLTTLCFTSAKSNFFWSSHYNSYIWFLTCSFSRAYCRNRPTPKKVSTAQWCGRPSSFWQNTQHWKQHAVFLSKKRKYQWWAWNNCSCYFTCTSVADWFRKSNQNRAPELEIPAEWQHFKVSRWNVTQTRKTSKAVKINQMLYSFS